MVPEVSTRTACRPGAYDHGTFRCFEFILIRTKPDAHLRTILSATVPKTDDLEADKAIAMEMINVQFFDRHHLFWEERISTDAEKPGQCGNWTVRSSLN
jgi:hypothetical protein